MHTMRQCGKLKRPRNGNVGRRNGELHRCVLRSTRKGLSHLPCLTPVAVSSALVLCNVAGLGIRLQYEITASAACAMTHAAVPRPSAYTARPCCAVAHSMRFDDDYVTLGCLAVLHRRSLPQLLQRRCRRATQPREHALALQPAAAAGAKGGRWEQAGSG